MGSDELRNRRRRLETLKRVISTVKGLANTASIEHCVGNSRGWLKPQSRIRCMVYENIEDNSN
jgi:hypothetical protein